MFYYYHYYIYRNSLFYHRNVNSFLRYFILFYFNSCMYGGRAAPKGELCNKVCMYVCMYVLPVDFELRYTGFLDIPSITLPMDYLYLVFLPN